MTTNTNMGIPVICMTCGTTGSVGRVTAALTCGNCHGVDLDIWDNTDSQKIAATAQQGTGTRYSGDPHEEGQEKELSDRESEGQFSNTRTAAPHGPGTGWGHNQDQHVLDDWNEYQGPPPSPNPENGSHTDGTADAYDGINWQRGNPDYLPGGGYEKNTWPTGPTTSRPPRLDNDPYSAPSPVGGAGWKGASNSQVVGQSYRILPPKNSSKTGPIGHVTPVKIVYADGHVWTPAGAMTNTTTTNRITNTASAIEKARRVTSDSGTRQGAYDRDSAKVLKMVAAISRRNPGLTYAESLNLARRAEQKTGDLSTSRDLF